MSVYRKAVLYGALTGCLLAMALIVAVVATGGTFGQRCGKAFPSDASARAACVKRLSDGGPITPPVEG